MKTKKNKGKLALNKISIANLGNDRISEVKTGLLLIKGGFLPNEPSNSCPTKFPPWICIHEGS